MAEGNGTSGVDGGIVKWISAEREEIPFVEALVRESDTNKTGLSQHRTVDEPTYADVDAVRVTGLSARQLQFWRREGFFPLDAGKSTEVNPFGSMYGMRDLVSLRALAIARQRYHAPTRELRKVAGWLRQHHNTAWEQLHFFIVAGNVYFDAAKIPGEGCMDVASMEMAPIAQEVESSVEALWQRRPEQIGQIARQRAVMGGVPVLAGTRIPTSTVWGFHQAGYSDDAIMREYPTLTKPDIAAAIEFERRNRTHAS